MGEPCPRIGDDTTILQGCLTEARGDFDGDGDEDVASVYAELGRGDLPAAWWLIVELSAEDLDGTYRLRPGEFSYPRAIGAVDANGDGRDELFVKVADHVYHAGLSPIVGIFGISERGLFPYSDEDGEPFLIDVGGVSNFGSGAECVDADDDGDLELVKLRIDSATSDRPRWSETTFEWRGERLVRGDTRTGRVTRDGYTDPDVFHYYQFRCLELDPPYPY